LNGTTEVLEELPQAVQKLRYAVTSWDRDGKGGALKQVQKTADELQKLAGASAAVVTPSTTIVPAPHPAPAPPPAPEPKAIVAAGTVGMATLMGQLVSGQCYALALDGCAQHEIR
jgi:hypothetical protein